jgi:hypothetical protein
MSYGLQYTGGRPIPGGLGGNRIPGGMGSSGGGGGGGVRPGITLEKTVRQFESPVVLALRARREKREAEESDDCILRWGRAPVWGNSDTTPEEERGGFQITNPKPPKPPEDTPVRVYTEVTRTTETVRVTNPTDASHYVDVARIKSITFRGPDNKDVRFDLKPPAA